MNISENSRIWIFQSKRPFSEKEKTIISNKLTKFIAGWNAHGADLLSDFDLPYNQFIVVGVDENQATASGCSIDKLSKLIRQFNDLFDLNLLDRMQIAYEENNLIKIEQLANFKQKIKSKELANIHVFNNGINVYGDYKKAWKLPLKESWAKSLLIE